MTVFDAYMHYIFYTLQVQHVMVYQVFHTLLDHQNYSKSLSKQFLV